MPTDALNLYKRPLTVRLVVSVQGLVFWLKIALLDLFLGDTNYENTASKSLDGSTGTTSKRSFSTPSDRKQPQ